MNRILQNSKVLKIMYEDPKTKETRLTLRQQNKSKMIFMSVEHHSDKISRKLNNFRRIADDIVYKQKLFHSTSMEDYLLSAGSIKTSASNRRLSNKRNE